MHSFLSISFYFSLVQKNLPKHLTAEIKISLWDLMIVNVAQKHIDIVKWIIYTDAKEMVKKRFDKK